MSQKFYENYWQDRDMLEDFAYKWPVLQKLLPKNQKLKFLDFGCGKGVILAKIAQIRPQYLISGTDISPTALQAAQERLPRASFKLISSNQLLPYPRNYFDFILASDVLEHIYDTRTAFAELSRVLKKGGQLLVTVPYNSRLKLILVTLLAFEFYFDPYSPHIRFFSPATLKRCLKDGGLRPEKIGYFGRFYPLSKGMYVLARK
ncbi:MAG: class I SAM-dependent methyltransferase [Patescibacteria group bacterium]